jgi:putative alpha-1,2-mannosidase
MTRNMRLVAWLALPLCHASVEARQDVLNFVDPLIGTVDGGERWPIHIRYSHTNLHKGHVFPGATLPFGMAKAVADVDKETQGGYASNDADSKSNHALDAFCLSLPHAKILPLVTGFSHMHDSGTGGVSNTIYKQE